MSMLSNLSAALLAVMQNNPGPRELVRGRNKDQTWRTSKRHKHKITLANRRKAKRAAK